VTAQPLYPRILRRERFRSRSGVAIVVLVIVALFAALVATECVLAILSLPALLVAPEKAVRWIIAGGPLAEGIGIALAVVGVLLLLIAILPSRRARHAVANERMAVVVDDGILAGALARIARRTAGLASDRVHVDVSRRRARVVLTPTSGMPVEARATQEAADTLLSGLAPRPSVSARVTVSRTGAVGS
jgi:hypothetical protein